MHDVAQRSCSPTGWPWLGIGRTFTGYSSMITSSIRVARLNCQFRRSWFQTSKINFKPNFHTQHNKFHTPLIMFHTSQPTFHIPRNKFHTNLSKSRMLVVWCPIARNLCIHHVPLRSVPCFHPVLVWLAFLDLGRHQDTDFIPLLTSTIFVPFNFLTPRERVLFIGTQFSILYTSMYSPAEIHISFRYIFHTVSSD
jgi:hypothetical protein